MMDEDRADGIDAGVGRVDDENRQYFEGRANWHRARARIASDAYSQSLHDRFAAIYDARAMGAPPL